MIMVGFMVLWICIRLLSSCSGVLVWLLVEIGVLSRLLIDDRLYCGVWICSGYWMLVCGLI